MLSALWFSHSLSFFAIPAAKAILHAEEGFVVEAVMTCYKTLKHKDGRKQMTAKYLMFFMKDSIHNCEEHCGCLK